MQQINHLPKTFQTLILIGALSMTIQIIAVVPIVDYSPEELKEQEASNRRNYEAKRKLKSALKDGNFENITDGEILTGIRIWKFDKTLILKFAQQEPTTAARLLEIIKETNCFVPYYKLRQLSCSSMDGTNTFHLIINKGIQCEISSLIKSAKIQFIRHWTRSPWAKNKYQKFLRKIFMAQDHSRGNTPLHYALSKDLIDIELVQKLTQYCPSAWQLTNIEGITPFKMAEAHPKASIFVFFHKVSLIKENIELIKKVLAYFPVASNVPDIDGNTPIHRAAMVPEVLSLFLDAAYAGKRYGKSFVSV